mmetsp:Transcript_17893/g.58412  ORF Transcript_17893/g.58412 Transcript_17893/m.58412 type:complete len:200 (+) Transcript_17893:876-1475(+)
MRHRRWRGRRRSWHRRRRRRRRRKRRRCTRSASNAARQRRRRAATRRSSASLEAIPAGGAAGGMTSASAAADPLVSPFLRLFRDVCPATHSGGGLSTGGSLLIRPWPLMRRPLRDPPGHSIRAPPPLGACVLHLSAPSPFLLESQSLAGLCSSGDPYRLCVSVPPPALGPRSPLYPHGARSAVSYWLYPTPSPLHRNIL